MSEISFDIKTKESAVAIIRMALEEDLATIGDVTSKATLPGDRSAEVNVVARESGVLCGISLVHSVYSELCTRGDFAVNFVEIEVKKADGASVEFGETVATIKGPIEVLLTGERIALNFLIHLSGIATLTAEFMKRIEGSRAVILDTRKTLPGYRLLHKYAVRCGGGTNHRMGLYDGILIKDNHLAARGNRSVADAVAAARRFLDSESLKLTVEVEVDTLEQMKDALAAQPDIVLLDNMNPSQLQAAVAMRNKLAPSTLLEASGGVNLESVGCIAGTGVDRISIGGLTHSAPALDLGFDWPW